MALNNVGPKLSVKASHYIIAGFGVVAALSWTNTIRDVVESLMPSPKGKLCAEMIYSLIITLILVLLILILPETKTELPVETQNKIQQKEMEALIGSRQRLL